MLTVFILYLVVLLVIGFIATRRAGSRDDFLLAGRQLGPFATALSAAATSMSGWLFLGLPGDVLRNGFSSAWAGFSCIFGDYANWRLTCARLRERSEAIGALTLPEFITGCRQDALSKLTRMLAGGGTVFFMTIYLWAQYVATGKALSGEFGLGLDYQAGVLLGSVVIIVYTTAGGFVAVVWTDVLQAIMMCLALIGLPLYLLYRVISAGQLDAMLSFPTPADASVAMADPWGTAVGFGIALMLISNFGIGAAYLGQPQIASRFMSLRDARSSTIARRISVTWTALTVLGAVLLALCAPVLLRQMPADPEQILLVMSTTYLPGWLAGMVIAALMAAVMSSADSFLIAAVSSVQQDFPGRLREAAKSTWVSRGVIVALGGVALVLAYTTDPTDPSQSVLALVKYAWGGLAITLAIPTLYCLAVARPYTGVVFATMTLGIGMMVVWNVTGLSAQVYEVIPVLAFQLGVAAIAHRVLRRREPPADTAPASAAA